LYFAVFVDSKNKLCNLVLSSAQTYLIAAFFGKP